MNLEEDNNHRNLTIVNCPPAEWNGKIIVIVIVIIVMVIIGIVIIVIVIIKFVGRL